MAIPQARYQIVKSHIKDLIDRNDMQPGDKLPSENALVKKLSISRMTVNRAFKELADEGLLVRQAGLGSFVAAQKAAVRGEALNVTDIKDEIEARGERWSAEVLINEVQVVPDRLAADMQVEEGTEMFRLRTIHFGNGVPVELEDRFVNLTLTAGIADIDFTQRTCSGFLLEKAPRLTAEHIIKAVNASPTIADLLDVDENFACLVIRRKSWSDGQLVSIANITYPGNRYEVKTRFSN